MSMKVKHSFLLVLTAMIWGFAFVAQSEGGNLIGAFSFNCIRSLLGAFVLIPVIFLLDKLKLTNKKPTNKEEKKRLYKSGILIGFILFLASSLQQLGINGGTQAGKAGFITACYILGVPLLGIFIGKKCPLHVWIGVALALVGLYMLCIKGSMSMAKSDILVLLCALSFSVHILVVDKYSPLVDGVRLSCIQFFVCGLCGILPMLFVDIRPWENGSFQQWLSLLMCNPALLSIAYAGIMSCGVAYTLQIIGQEGVNPTVASLLMSLESVFSVIGGAILLKERMTIMEYMGCVLLFAAIIFAQLPMKRERM